MNYTIACLIISLFVFFYNIELIERSISNNKITIGVMAALAVSLPWVVVYLTISGGVKIVSKILGK